MAQIGPAGTQLSQGYMTNQEPGLNSAFAVVNQRPRQRESFPYRLHGNWILAFSILNCICGLMLMSVNIVNMVGLRVKEKFTAPTWSSAIFIINGVIGCVMKCHQNKCLTGAFFAFSILSLIPVGIMLWLYADILHFLVGYSSRRCYYVYGVGYICRIYTADHEIKLISFLLSIIACELICSIGSVVVSCKAYSKCCNTCNANDCCTCLGCCECDCYPLNASQSGQPNVSCHDNYQYFEMSSVQQRNLQNYLNQPQFSTTGQDLPACAVQRAQHNECSGIASYVISVPER